MPYALNAEPARPSFCRHATQKPCSFISTKSQQKSPQTLTPFYSSPRNISLLPLPPRSPELNSQENIWQFMRQNWLSNRIFKSFDDIVDHCCYSWNTLIDQPWKIMSIALRDWATVGHPS